jgi:hypothetical protein
MAENRTLKGIYGEAGATVLTGTQEVTKDICAIQVLDNAILDGQAGATNWPELSDTATSGSMLANTGDANGVTLDAGITIYGQFKKVKLRSGTVICYHASK